MPPASPAPTASRAARRCWPERGLAGLYTASLFQLCRRRRAAPGRRSGTRTQFRRAGLLGQAQPRLPVAGHRRLPAPPSAGALSVRRRCRSARRCRWPRASSWSRTTSASTAAAKRWRSRGARSSYFAAPPSFGDLDADTAFRRAEGQPRRARRHGADALQAIHRAVRTRRRALPRVRRGSGIQRFDRRADRGRPAPHPTQEAPALPAGRRIASA